MITGKVTAQREARLRLTILVRDRREQAIDVVIDTGFNGSLTLPGDMIRSLRLRSVGARPVILADGSRVLLRLYRASVLWHERERDVMVLRADGAPLLGMALLYGSRVVLNVVQDGDVTIDPLP